MQLGPWYRAGLIILCDLVSPDEDDAADAF
jgi:hypothetical protein